MWVGFIVITPYFYSKTSSIVLFLFLQLAIFLFVWLIKPFERKFDNFIEIYSELVLLFYVTILVIFSDNSMWSEAFSMTICALIFVNCFILSTAWVVDITVYLIKCMIKKWMASAKVSFLLKIDSFTQILAFLLSLLLSKFQLLTIVY